MKSRPYWYVVQLPWQSTTCGVDETFYCRQRLRCGVDNVLRTAVIFGGRSGKSVSSASTQRTNTQSRSAR